jgi:hypothetical protein
VTRGRVSVRGRGGGGQRAVPALGRTTVQGEATMLRTAGGKERSARRWKRSPSGRGGRRGGGRALGGRGRSGTKPPARVPGADGGGPAAWRGERASADFGRLAAAENPVGQRTGGAAEGSGRGGLRHRRRRRTQRRQWRWIGDEKVAKCWRGRVAAFIYRHTFSPGSCNEP